LNGLIEQWNIQQSNLVTPRTVTFLIEYKQTPCVVSDRCKNNTGNNAWTSVFDVTTSSFSIQEFYINGSENITIYKRKVAQNWATFKSKCL
jgi:hypothetical protein